MQYDSRKSILLSFSCMKWMIPVVLIRPTCYLGITELSVVCPWRVVYVESQRKYGSGVGGLYMQGGGGLDALPATPDKE